MGTATSPVTPAATPLTVDSSAVDTTTERLVAAAAQVFGEKGYDGAGVAEIARRAGLTTGAIYSRFSGKAELLAAAIRSCTEDEFDQLFADHAFDGRATDLLRTVGSHLVTRRPQPGHALLLEAFVAARRDEEVARLLRSHLAERAARLAGLVDASKVDGVVDPEVDTRSIVHLAHAVGLGFLLFEALGVASPDPRAWEDLVGRVVASVMPPDRPTRGPNDPTEDPNDPTEDPNDPTEDPND
ncbi:TetR/AcrR family transcriptional regulator [Rhabdothermincola sediminis]|uniref:TetR/AcrR family transcriptional regulator n=1 Tax=Rhabdothermincola sediminis TaxID=2751370 RepID=UPI001AA04F74|nr:TetR/AcrR family transcriptional regulator [Rhabdothermincola sediminis]